MPKIIGIDLGTTCSKIAVWDDDRQAAILIPNHAGNRITPSVVGFDQAGQVFIGDAVEKNPQINFENTVASIAREMGRDYHVMQHGKSYNPQVISAFILRYLKQCAEAYLGEPVFDAVITCPVYYTDDQRNALRDAATIAGLNVHRTINSSTAAAIAFGIEKRAEVEDKFFMVCDLGGDAFNVSVVEFGSVITVEGTGGVPRMGGLEMDEAVTRWALNRIGQLYGADLSSNEGVRYRLKKAAAQLKKTLANSESASLSVPYLALVDGHVLSPDLKITRAQFEALITPMLERVKCCIEESMTSVAETSGVNWEDMDGCLLVGGCSRLPVFQKILRELFEQHCPGIEPEFHMDLNPDEAAAMGAAILGTKWAPIGIPPDRDESEKLEAQGHNLTFKETDPDIELYDVTSHTLGIALDGFSFHRLIHKNTFLPVSVNLQDITNGGNSTKMVLELYQGEDDFVAANTRIGEVKIEGFEPLPAGQHRLEVEFIIERSGIISTVCTDQRTEEFYPSTITYSYDDMGQEEIKKWQAEVETQLPEWQKVKSQSPVQVKISPDIKEKVKPIPKEPLVVPQLSLETIPAGWRDYWVKCLSLLPQLDRANTEILTRALINFADAVKQANPGRVEENGSLLQDALLEVWI